MKALHLDEEAHMGGIRKRREEKIVSYHLTGLSPFDVAVAIGFALLFFMLVFSSLMTLYLRHFWLFGVVICFNIFLPTRLRMSRQTLARNRERRLPLSI
ncbi:hypothetical protein JHK85_030899 [Glycine max]|nr:hypothetical protein JHK85_030899 [Glycine max]KAG4993535.1 hypothetical protein JHK86_030362 [Glycine max]